MLESEGDRSFVHVPPGGGRSVWFNGGLVTFYALGEDTGGAFTLFEEAIAPQDRALPHLHHEEDQAFYVLEGEHEFVCDGRAFAAGVGSFVYVPRGTVHSYENVGTEPGRLLILSTPAGAPRGSSSSWANRLRRNHLPRPPHRWTSRRSGRPSRNTAQT